VTGCHREQKPKRKLTNTMEQFSSEANISSDSQNITRIL
jgi:hypothetical protein